MSSTTLFEKTLQGYRARLEEDSSASFHIYCREVNVDHKAMQHWLSTEGIILAEVKSRYVKTEKKLTKLNKGTMSVFVMLQPMETQKPETDLFHKVSISFPDGVVVSIKEASARSLNHFINHYNLKTEEVKSCLG